MRNLLPILLLAFTFTNNVNAQDEDYTASKIPAALLTGANAVIRSSHTDIQIESNTDILVTNRYAVTVLSEEGNSHERLKEQYNKFFSIQSIEGWLYDKDNKQVAHITKKSEKLDAAEYGSAFFDDFRYKFCEFKYKEYPYTCVFEVVTKYNNSYFLPRWMPQKGFECSVENTDIVVTYPRELKLNVLPLRMDKQPAMSMEDGKRVLKMSLKNLPAIPTPDDFTPADKILPPSLVMITDKMELGNIKGNFSTWKEYGTLIYNLNDNRYTLPDETKKQVHQLTDTCTSVYSKVSLLYEYLQASTRYVCITTGIGGLQTLDANFVATKGYGDCKALSNYMKSLLKEAGIPAYQALVYGGDKELSKMIIEFPFHASNHVILCVPQAKDSIWVECTSKKLPAGYLSDFTSNRNVLLLTPDGGFIVKTPGYDYRQNILARKAVITVDDKDEMHGTVTASYAGWWWDIQNKVLDAPKSKNDDYFNSKFAIPSYKVGNYKISSAKNNGIPIINEEVPLNGSGNIAHAGKRMFLSPQVLNLSVTSATAIDTKTDSFAIFSDYQVNDTTIMIFSTPYVAEKLANEVNYDMPFGTYHSKVTFINNNTLSVVVNYHQKEGVYPPEQFANYKKMSKAINMNEAYGKVVLNKKE